MTMNRRFLAFGLALFSLSSLGLFVTKTNSEPASKFPGIFITDTSNRWHIPGASSAPDEQLGYVICDGGYLGSPIIPNEKKIVDQFLAACSTRQRVGPGKLPIINVAANNKKSSGYPAYTAKFNGQTYHLCHGFLNSSNWCSYEAEKKAIDLVTQIRRGENVQIAQSEAVPPAINEYEREALGGRPYPVSGSAPMVDEIAREVAQTVQPRLQSELESRKAIQITKDEYDALQRGETSLDKLTSDRPILSLNGEGEPRGVLQAQPHALEKVKLETTPLQPQSKAITITESQLAALKNGQISINDILAGQVTPNVMPSAIASALNNPAVKVVPLNGTPEAALSALPPEVAQVVAQVKPLPLNGPVQTTAAVPQVVNLASANLQLGAQLIPLTPGSQGPSISPEQISQIAAQMSAGQAPQPQMVALPQAQAMPMQMPHASPPQIVSVSPGAQGPSVSPELIAQIVAQVQAMQMQGQQMPAMTAQPMQMQQMPMQAVPMQVQPMPLQMASYANQPYAPNPGYMMPQQPAYYGYGVPATQATTSIYGTHSNTMYWPGYSGWY